MYLVSQFLLLLATASSITCHCPRDKIYKTGLCSYRYQCTGTIRGEQLPDECQGSNNYLTFVDLTIIDMSDTEKFDNQDSEFLESITTFRASGHWLQTNLSFLEYMPRLVDLSLTGNRIHEIMGSPFYNLNSLEVIDLSRNMLTVIEDEFHFENTPNNMRKLLLAHNAIKYISSKAFAQLTSLKELDLSHNFISDLSEKPFGNLTNLKTLLLNNNRIKDLNGAVNNLINLNHLYLKANHIQNFDVQSLNIIYDLQTFDISGNQLDKLNPALFSRHWQHLGGQCKLLLSNNKITSILNATTEQKMRFIRNSRRNGIDILTEIDLANNKISNIEYNAFQSIVKLTSLDLSRNELTKFAINPEDLIHIKYLNLSSNGITNLYFESFLSMANLQNLDLSHNKLDTIPESTFTSNYNLMHVNITHNYIKVLESLHLNVFHGDGRIVDLSNNGLTKLIVPTGNELHLTMLILNSNNITDASFITLNEQSKLKNLEMSGNHIRELDKESLHLPLALLSLDLSRNEIQVIGPSSFHRNPHLRTLRLSHNQLKNIEYGAFKDLAELSHLSLSHNNIKTLDSKVFMDMKSLSILSLSFNDLYLLQYNAWLGHKSDLKVYLDGNQLSCDWLAKALSDYNNGFSRMRPTVLTQTTGHSLEGVPCEKKKEDMGDVMMADDRLLITEQKILETLREQTTYLKRLLYNMRYYDNYNKVIDDSDKRI